MSSEPPDGEDSDLVRSHIEESKQKARKGVRAYLLRRFASVALSFVSMATVARLLTPHDFGLAVMSSAVLSFVMIFRDFGMTNALLRKGHISDAEVNMIFWTNVIITTTLAIIIAFMAPAVGAFYDEPIVASTILVSLIGFEIGGFALQHRALIARELRYSTLAAIDVASQAIGFLATLTLALIKPDVWALVIGEVVSSCFGACMAIHLSGWKPSRPKWSSDFWDAVRFGANSSVYSIAVFLSNNASSFIIGRVLNADALGQFNRAQMLSKIPVDNLIAPITSATLPLLNRLRPYPHEYRQSYLGMVSRLSVILMPVSVILYFTGVPLTLVVLGERWSMAGQILAIIAPTIAIMSLGYSVGDLFVTQNRSQELRNLGLFELIVRVGAVAVGVSFGIIVAAWAFTISRLFVILLRVYVSGRKGPISILSQLQATMPGVAPALGCLIGCVAALRLPLTHSPLVQLMIIGSAGAVGTAVAGLLHHVSRRALLELAELFGLTPLFRKLLAFRM